LGGALAAAILITAAGAQEKKVKDQEEYNLSDATFKALAAQKWTDVLTDIDAWKAKYPESDWKDDREFFILQADYSSKQFDKALTFGNTFIDRDLAAMFKANLGNVMAAYYMVIDSAAQLIQNGTPEQLAIGDKAAHKLLAFAPTYFVPANQPAGQTPQSFAQTQATMLALANGYLLQEAVTPGVKAMTKKDCPTAETVFTRALGAYPENSWISHQLARAYNCEEKPFQALYEYARAAAVDPTLGKTTDGPKFSASVKKMYVTLHGGDDGFEQLLETAKGNPIPAPDFKIETDDERKAKAAEAFQKANPEIATWMSIKTNLTSQGAGFFESMKGAEVPMLLATIADAKPACRPKELILYVPSPENTAKTNEITLKFETALAGKPELGTNIKFVGVAEAYAPAPFLLTMTAEKDKVQDLKLTPCTVAPAKKGTKKKE
jgi:hypothetical protein